MKVIKMSGLALALLGGAASAQAQPTSAQTCQVVGEYKWANVGQVILFGDMKVRINATKESGPNPAWFDVDIKAPGFAENGLRIWDDRPIQMTICGQDVTITKPVSYQGLTVSVF